jgi:20S proteasome alpha/beta subunit
MEAISHAGTCVGILSNEGIVLAAEKKVTSKLLDQTGQSEKMYRIDEHIGCALAGMTSDANILTNYARQTSQKYLFSYGEPCPVEQLVKTVCDLKQGYTQFGGSLAILMPTATGKTHKASFMVFRPATFWCFLVVRWMGQALWLPALSE